MPTAASRPGETTVLCITGNGLKTTDALAGRYDHLDARAIRPRLADFDAYLRSLDGETEPELIAAGERKCPLKLCLPTAFARHTDGRKQFDSNAANLPALLAEFDQTFPALSTQIKDENGKLRKFINIYINDEDIRFLGGDAYAFQDGDEVMLIPSIAGGTANFSTAIAVTARGALRMALLRAF